MRSVLELWLLNPRQWNSHPLAMLGLFAAIPAGFVFGWLLFTWMGRRG